jgi:hypothetical protein
VKRRRSDLHDAVGVEPGRRRVLPFDGAERIALVLAAVQARYLRGGRAGPVDRVARLQCGLVTIHLPGNLKSPMTGPALWS